MGETSIGGSCRTFEPTLWTVVLRARGHSREALEELLQAYWKPVYFYIRRWGESVENSKDLTQGFFAEFLERDFLKDVSREKGRFRTFLVTALRHFLINEAERVQAKKRGGGRELISLDFKGAETQYRHTPVAKENIDRIFKREWALTVLSRALEALGREMDAQTFEALKPHLAGGPAYAETAQKLGITTTELNNLIHKTRKRYRDLLKREVAGSVADPELVDEELKDLFEALKS